jgi:tyrosine-protein kinase Etk/Wzc
METSNLCPNDSGRILHLDRRPSGIELSILPEEFHMNQDQIPGRKLIWLRVTAKWKRLTLSTAGTVIAFGVIALMTLSNWYTATTLIMPPQASSSTASALMNQMNALGAMASANGGLGIKNPNDQQISLLKTQSVETALVNRFDLRRVYHVKYVSSACRAWERHAKADSGIKDGLIRLSVTDTDPNRTAQLANAWVDEYRRFTATLAITEASQRRLFYEQQLDLAKRDLASAEDAMKGTQQRTGVIDIEGQDRTLLASAAVLRAQLAAKQIEIKAMRQFASDRNPDLERAEQELSGMEGQLGAMDADADRKDGDIVVPKGNVSEGALEYTRALREVKYREAIVDLLTRQYEGARVDEAKQGSLIQVIDEATAPEKPSLRIPIWVLLAAIVLAIPLGIGVALAVDWVASTYSTIKSAGSIVGGIEQVFGGPRRDELLNR